MRNMRHSSKIFSRKTQRIKGKLDPTHDLEISEVNIPTLRPKHFFSLYQVVQVFLNPSLSLLCVIILFFSFIIEKKIKSK